MPHPSRASVPLLLLAALAALSGNARATAMRPEGGATHLLLHGSVWELLADVQAKVARVLELPTLASRLNPHGSAQSQPRGMSFRRRGPFLDGKAQGVSQTFVMDSIKIAIAEPRLASMRKIRVRALLASQSRNVLTILVEEVGAEGRKKPVNIARRVRLADSIDSRSPVVIQIAYEKGRATAVELLLRKTEPALRALIRDCEMSAFEGDYFESMRVHCLHNSAKDRCAASKLSAAKNALQDKSCSTECAVETLKWCGSEAQDIFRWMTQVFSRLLLSTMVVSVLFVVVGGALLTILALPSDLFNWLLQLLCLGTFYGKKILAVLLRKEEDCDESEM